MLQWGRGCSAAECFIFLIRTANAQKASMGPRLFSRGMPSVSHHSHTPIKSFNGAAAVQPRNGDHGNNRSRPGSRFNGAAAVQPRNVPNIGGDLDSVVVLQWGRGCSAAECSHVTEAFRWDYSPLQWGRGCSAAEWTAPAALATVTDPLQWGRGCSAAECVLWLGCVRIQGRASMGPRLFSRGMLHGRIQAGLAQGRFNGAAAVQPRNAGRAAKGR